MLFSPILFSLKGRSNSLKDVVTVLAPLVCTFDKAPVAPKKNINKDCEDTKTKKKKKIILKKNVYTNKKI